MSLINKDIEQILSTHLTHDDQGWLQASCQTSEGLDIRPLSSGAGYDLTVRPGVISKQLVIPNCLGLAGAAREYNFDIGAGARVELEPGCELGLAGETTGQVVNRWHVGAGAKVVYRQQRLDTGWEPISRTLDEQWEIELAPGAVMVWDLVALESESVARRSVRCLLSRGARLIVAGRVLVSGDDEMTLDVISEGATDARLIIDYRVVVRERARARITLPDTPSVGGRVDAWREAESRLEITTLDGQAFPHPSSAMAVSVTPPPIAAEEKWRSFGMTRREARDRLAAGFLRPGKYE